MYKCQVTGRMSRLGDKLNKITVARRERIYTKWVKNEETLKYEEVFVAKGWEIVRELNASQSGVEQWEAMTPEQRTLFLRAWRPNMASRQVWENFRSLNTNKGDNEDILSMIRDAVEAIHSLERIYGQTGSKLATAALMDDWHSLRSIAEARGINNYERP